MKRNERIWKNEMDVQSEKKNEKKKQHERETIMLGTQIKWKWNDTKKKQKKNEVKQK